MKTLQNLLLVTLIIWFALPATSKICGVRDVRINLPNKYES
ncbi:hypothetical protein SAMN03080601_00974 [Alkalitalea saponilacus]|uniref:Uncharacterized protein n=1 Tax=Alkalitalea saponilacus TaxID=889453 RepID=A0A1T5D4H1_9BACT|nr:hypothetical protein SAMN03080601_00974 [Alkalitalea saponilacus]